MKNLVIVSIIVSIVLMGVIYGYVGDIIGDDMVNILSMVAALAILGLTVGVGLKYINQMKTDKATGELAEENWDGIGEFKNELPIGWSLSYIGTIIFFVWYHLIGYPVWSYSQIGEYNEEVQAYNEKFEEVFQNANNDELNAMGESVFLVNCAPCHGVTGDGMGNKAKDLTKWGNEEGIINTIAQGSKGLNYQLGEMPAGLVDKKTAKAISAYIMKELSPKKHTKYPKLVKQGKAMFGVCAGCHGIDGKGNGGMAPDLTKYGSYKFVVNVLERGKVGFIGQMPQFKVEEMRITKTQQKAVGTYISNLNDE
jgi:cytochrome c oxidase cbb3-type subunit 3